jgi:hypothetical protein
LRWAAERAIPYLRLSITYQSKNPDNASHRQVAACQGLAGP